MKTLRDIVSTTMSIDKINIIIDQYEQWEYKGYVPNECDIRTICIEYCENNNIPLFYFTHWMKELAFECYRYKSEYYQNYCSELKRN